MDRRHAPPDSASLLPPAGDEAASRSAMTDPGRIIQWLATRDGDFLFVTPSWHDFTGQAPQDALGIGWLSLVHPDDGPALQEAFSAAPAGQGFRRHFRLSRAEGGTSWMLMDAQARPGGFIGVCMPAALGAPVESETEQVEQHLAELLRHTRLAAVALDIEGRVRFANGALLGLLGRPAGEVVERHFFDAFTPPGSLAPPWPPTDDGQAHDFPLEFETEILDCSDRRRLLLWHAVVLRDQASRLRGLALVGDDITAKRQAEQRLVLTHKVFETTEMAMIITDAEVRIVAANSAFSRLTGYDIAEAIGQNPRILQSDRHDRPFYQRMWHSLLTTGHWHGEIWDRRKDGSYYPKFLSVSSITDAEGKVTHYCGIFYDISERKSIEDKLDHLAHYDALTDLPNRTLLHERLDRAVTAAARAETKVALLYLDLDHFKEVNDTLGHDFGDQLLQEVARRLRQCVRGYDTVARLGGDEFVVLLVDVLQRQDISLVAGKLLEAISTPFALDGREFIISTSIGISLFPDDHFKLEILLKHADQAMYRAKAGGRAGFLYFDELRAA